MKISSEGLNILEAEKTKKDVSALMTKFQTLIKTSFVSYIKLFL
jgi:hypothetical protein